MCMQAINDISWRWGPLWNNIYVHVNCCDTCGWTSVVFFWKTDSLAKTLVIHPRNRDIMEAMVETSPFQPKKSCIRELVKSLDQHLCFKLSGRTGPKDQGYNAWVPIWCQTHGSYTVIADPGSGYLLPSHKLKFHRLHASWGHQSGYHITCSPKELPILAH